MNDMQQQAQEAIDQLVESGAERGLQVAVYWHGGLVVDAVAGIADPATGRLVTSDTPFYTYSTGKGATAAVAHVLASAARSITTPRSWSCGRSSAPTAKRPRPCATR